jgi:hypothetical protein
MKRRPRIKGKTMPLQRRSDVHDGERVGLSSGIECANRRSLRVRGFKRSIRQLGRAIVIVGLAVFYGSLVSKPFGPPETLVKAGVITAAVGCLWLTGLLLWLYGDKGRAVFERTLGFFCLPAAFLSTFAALGDELGLQLPWLIIAVIIWVGVLGLLGQATRMQRQSVKTVRH